MKKSARTKQRALRRGAPGTAPGSLIVDPHAPKPEIHVTAFGPDTLIERKLDRPGQLREVLGLAPVCWINIDGLGDAQVLQEIADIFHIHPLAMEDVVNVHQRAKVDTFGQQTFIVTHMVALENGHASPSTGSVPAAEKNRLDTEQLSLFLVPESSLATAASGKNASLPPSDPAHCEPEPGRTPPVPKGSRGYVLTFQERPGGDSFDPVRARIRMLDSRIRDLGADYLAYALIDAVIDHYFPVLEAYGERLEALEDRIIVRPDASLIAEIHEVKRELLYLRRAIWPLREAVNTLVRDPIPLITDDTRLYLRDCYDHAVRIIDLVETYREVCSDLMDLYLSSVSNRMNEIMKVLTVMSTLFIPLTFVVGVYGMNFEYMPELKSPWGYGGVWGVMIVVFVAQLTFLWHKGWLSPIMPTAAAPGSSVQTTNGGRPQQQSSPQQSPAFPGAKG